MSASAYGVHLLDELGSCQVASRNAHVVCLILIVELQTLGARIHRHLLCIVDGIHSSHTRSVSMYEHESREYDSRDISEFTSE